MGDFGDTWRRNGGLWAYGDTWGDTGTKTGVGDIGGMQRGCGRCWGVQVPGGSTSGIGGGHILSPKESVGRTWGAPNTHRESVGCGFGDSGVL